MQIAVTGANGFVGRELLAKLGEAGHVVVPLVRTPSGLPGEIITGDLDDGGFDPAALAGCDAVIHLAARTHVMTETASDPIAAYRATNVAGTDRLLDACIANRVRRFVFMSSVKAIGEWSNPGDQLGPDATPRPEDAYGISKLEAEQLVRERCDAAGIEWVILRPPLVYGPGVKANFERLFHWVRRGVPLPFGAIDNRRSLVDVANLADAAVLAATIADAPGRSFMVSDVTISTPAMVRAIAKATLRRPRLVAVPPALLRLMGRLTGKGDVVERLCGSLVLDSTRTKEILGWEPRRSFEQSLAAIARGMETRAADNQNGKTA